MGHFWMGIAAARSSALRGLYLRYLCAAYETGVSSSLEFICVREYILLTGEMKTGETMSVVESDTAACPGRSFERGKNARIRSRRHSTESSPYSPVMCLSLLLIVGLIIQIGPAIRAYLAQGW